MTTPALCTSGPIDIALVVGGRWHDFGFARMRLLALLDAHDAVRCSVHEDYSDVAALSSADAVIAYTCDVRPTAEQAAALAQGLQAGGRLLALHATNSAIDAPAPGGPRVFRTPDAMPEFSAILGNRFLAHPKIAPYRIDPVQPNHPFVSGVRSFTTTDEIYLSELAADINVILDTRYSGSCPGFETDNTGDRSRHPVLFTRPEGQGTVTYFTLGHCRGRFDLTDMGIEDLGVVDRVAWESPEFTEVLRRTVAWAVHGEQWPSCPVEQHAPAEVNRPAEESS